MSGQAVGDRGDGLGGRSAFLSFIDTSGCGGPLRFGSLPGPSNSRALQFGLLVLASACSVLAPAPRPDRRRPKPPPRRSPRRSTGGPPRWARPCLSAAALSECEEALGNRRVRSTRQPRSAGRPHARPSAGPGTVCCISPFASAAPLKSRPPRQTSPGIPRHRRRTRPRQAPRHAQHLDDGHRRRRPEPRRSNVHASTPMAAHSHPADAASGRLRRLHRRHSGGFNYIFDENG